jgi:hypothetical protein
MHILFQNRALLARNDDSTPFVMRSTRQKCRVYTKKLTYKSDYTLNDTFFDIYGILAKNIPYRVYCGIITGR